MSDKHEMTAKEFLQTMKRMCYEYGGCGVCPMEKAVGPKTTCATWRIHHPDEAIAIVKKWAQEHPKKKCKTYSMDFFEKFPKAWRRNGVPAICRNEVYKGKSCPLGMQARFDPDCAACWNEEMEDADE